MQYLVSMLRGRVNCLLRLAMALLLVASPISGHATLYVIVVGRNEIAITADSRLVTVTAAQVATTDGIQKVISLGSKIAFMSAGVGEISTQNVTITPDQIAKECFASVVKNSQRVGIGQLADAFGQAIKERLDRLSASGKAQIASSIVQQFGSQDNQVMESTFAGVNDDGRLVIETVNVDIVPPSTATENAKFEWTRHETPGDRPNIILSGEASLALGHKRPDRFCNHRFDLCIPNCAGDGPLHWPAGVARSHRTEAGNPPCRFAPTTQWLLRFHRTPESSGVCQRS